MNVKKLITGVLALSLFMATGAVAAATPVENKPEINFVEVQTSGDSKAKVGPYQGDDTIIIDSEGNQTTAGELKALTNFKPAVDYDEINKLNSLPGNENSDNDPPTILSAYGNAWAYVQNNSTSINCYAYSVRFPAWINPGDGDGTPNYNDSGYFTNVNYTAGLVVADGNTNGLYFKSPWRTLSGLTSAVNSDEHRIALRVGWIDLNNNGTVDISSDLVDYHFMLQNNTGKWSEKAGQTPSKNTGITNPSTHSWDLGNYKNFYNSSTAYIAAKVW